ncbi:C39 family peptidase [Flavihumibacter solisilvae]|nr:C39 family peptidase [Flavihumibacter solisilvae]
MKTFIIVILINLFAQETNTKPEGNILDIDPVYQQTQQWCWVSCGEMVFKYYDICSINPVGDYQCGIIALLHPQCDYNCYSCVVSAGTTQRIINMFKQYPAYARSICGSYRSSITCTEYYGALSTASIMASIDDDMPILAGVNPSGRASSYESEHACLIIGYMIDDDDEVTLIVNDPYPYDRMGVRNPYYEAGGDELQLGQYEIEYYAFRRQLAWNRSLSRIR